MQLEGEDDNELLLDTPMVEDEPAPEDHEEIILELDDDELAERDDDLPVVKKLRAKLRDEQRDKLAIKRDLEATRRSSQPAPVEVGPEPVWTDNEDKWEYDADKFFAAKQAWQKRKEDAERATSRQTEAQRAQSEEFERVRAQHNARAARLPGVTPELAAECEKAVVDAIGNELTGAAMVLAKDSARLMVAIGRKPELLQKLADEPNPLVKLKMLRDWEDKIVTRRNPPPPPEAPTIQRGSASLSKPAHEKELAKLEAEADRTGKRDKVLAFKRQLKERSKAA